MPATKSASRRGSKFTSYEQIMHIANLPNNKRRELAIGRDGTKIRPRKYHLSEKEVEVLKTQLEQGDKLPNPHNKGFYHYFIETMKGLGLNRNHSIPVVHAKFKEIAGNAGTKDGDGKTFWQRWSKKEARNEETGKDWTGRFATNVEVLQRMGGFAPYGLRLLQVGTLVMGTKGCTVNTIKGSGGQLMYCLDTNSAEPINENRVRGQKEETVTVSRKPKVKAAKKTAPKTRKPKAVKAVPVAETTDAPVAEAVAETATA